MFVLVAYDISDTSRRNRVAKILSSCGERVNFSVFECEFKKAEIFRKLKRELKGAIRPKEDHVRYYPICRKCRNKISVQGYGGTTGHETVRFA